MHQETVVILESLLSCSSMMYENLVKSPAFPLPHMDLCWAQGQVRAAETFLMAFKAGYIDRILLPATQSSQDLGPLLIFSHIN